MLIILLLYILVIASVDELIQYVIFKERHNRIPIEYTSLDGKNDYTAIYHHNVVPHASLQCVEYAFNNNDNVILFIHGSSGSIRERMYIRDICKHLNINLFLYDYRGYGYSSGIPDHSNICSDSVLVYDYIKKKYSSVIVWGESLGGCVACYLSSKRSIDNIVIQSTFSSMRDVVGYYSSKFTILRMLTCLYDCKMLDTLSYIRNSVNKKCNVIVAHSEEDELLPYYMCEDICREYRSLSSNIIKVRMYGSHSAPRMRAGEIYNMVSFLFYMIGRQSSHEEINNVSSNIYKVMTSISVTGNDLDNSSDNIDGRSIY